MKKRLSSMLLVLVMMLGMLPVTALAASSEAEALGEVSIYNGGQKLSYLSINGRVRELIYTYFNYMGENGKTKEIPAYCVNPNTKGVPQTVASGQSIKYLAEEKGNDPKVMGIIANGYPTRGLAELKLENKYHAYYATKMALWCYLLPNWNINNLKVNPNLTGTEFQRAQAILTAAKDIYVRGTAWSKVYSPRVTATPDRDAAYATTVNGQQYKQQVFTIHSDTWVCNYAVRVAFTDPSSIPAGTRIVDMDNNDITTITTSSTGDGYAGKFKVLYPASAVAGKTGSVQLSFVTEVYKYAVFYATCAEVGKYGQLQNYMCDTDPTTTMKLSTYSNYSDGGEVEPPDTGLKITKLEKGTDTPLSGAVFEVVDPDGATVGTFATGADGTVTIPLTLAGNYTVYERVAPLDHLLSDNPAQNIKAEYGKMAELTYWNEPYGTLRIEKLSDTGAHLPGAMVQIKHIESGVTYTAETNFAGYAIFDNIRPGAYEIKEITAPSGWLKDDATYTATVSTGEMTTFSIVNKELPGLRIIKYDRKNMVAMSGVTFEVWRDGVSLGKFRTDEFGEILLTDVAPGTYRTVKEKSSASIPRERKANGQTAASGRNTSRYITPENTVLSETSSAEKARPLDEKQQFEARRQFVVDKQKNKRLSERLAVHSMEEPPAFYDAEWEPVSPSKTDTLKHSAFKEKKRFAVNDHSRNKPEKPLPAPKVKRTSFKTAAKPISAAQKTASQQQIHQTAAQAKKAAKTAVELFKRTAGILRRAAAALISASAGFVGGTVVLVALVVIIIIAAVASSPFGLYFAAERNAPNTVSVAEAVAQVNIAYNAKLEALQAGDYDSIDIQGQAQDWPEVLAVFAAKTAGTDDGVDVATLDADRVARLTAVFWDMTEITSWVEAIDHPGSGDDDGWTEYILHITITPKTTDEMRTIYSFTRYQNEALDELLADRATLASLVSSLTITNADAVQVLQSLPADLSPERKTVVQNALTLYGKVSYFWGGKSLVIGWDSRWGELRQVTAAGSSTTGTYRPYGLDCSGFVDWVFYNATGGGYIIGHGGGATMQHAYCTDISWSDAQPGDLVFYPDNSHVGIVCGRAEDGSLLVIHCASGANNVVITGMSGFVSVARPNYYGE